MNTQFDNPFLPLELKRFPYDKNQTLQAWDAADEYLLNELSNQKVHLNEKNILIFNDSFGALACALAEFTPYVMTDSYISELAIQHNLATNKIDSKSIEIINSLTKHKGQYDYVIVKLPKILDYLGYFLSNLSNFINSETKIIIAGMVKNMPKSVWNIIEKNIGSTTTSLAKKKARLIFATYSEKDEKNAFPTYFNQENTLLNIYNHANVFSKQSLDIGTRFLLQNLPKIQNIKTIIDLGCGNGIVGLNLGLMYPDAKIIFTDESYMAVDSAKLTIEKNIINRDKYTFLVNNCLDGFDVNATDLIVCNPPFHQSHTIGMHIALKMFKQSYQTLKKGGHFIVVANKHLPYQVHLKKLFGTTTLAASNKKFSIFRMKK